MARRVFFSFEYGDVSRAMIVRQSWVVRGREAAGFTDAAAFERIKVQGSPTIKRWIDRQLMGTTVTVVLVGARTCTSRWVRYEIDESKRRGNGLLGVDISKIRDFHGRTAKRCGKLPTGYPFYFWHRDGGYRNLGRWIERAGRAGGRGAG